MTAATVKSSVQARILFAAADQSGGGFYRMHTPANVLQNSQWAHTLCHNFVYDEASIKALSPDAVVFQHPTTDQEIQTVKSYRKALPKATLVYDIDDNFWAVPEESAHKAALPKDIKARIVTAANLCDRITVSTAPLAKVMAAATTVKDIQVVPNYLTQDVFTRMASTRRKNRTEHAKPRIGWVGGIGHGGDIKLLQPLIHAFKDKVQWVFMGMIPEMVDPATLEIHDVVHILNYHEKLASLDLDLALAPLAEHDFNESKSGLRVVEYGGAGYPVIASDITPYKDFKNITRLPFMPAVWESSIRAALTDLSALEAQGESLHTEIKTNYIADAHAEYYAKAFLPSKTQYHVPHFSPKSENTVVVIGAQIESAAQDYPDADILWIADKAELPASSLEVMQGAMTVGVGSVSVLSNDGMYPALGQFARLQPAIVDQIRVAAEECGNTNAIATPHPLGSAVLLRAAALARIGIPDQAKFGNRTAALIDWGARANAAGFSAALCPQAYAYAYEPDSTSQEQQNSAVIVQGWNPIFGAKLAEFKHQEQITFAVQNIELQFNKNQYKHPLTTQSYEDWFAVFSTIMPPEKEEMIQSLQSWPSTPSISIIMPVYNPPLNELRAAIASAQEQIYPFWELLIVDDCSTNPAIRFELQKAAENDSRIKVKYRETNGHICLASNDALAMATGDWMVCLDHDDILEPHALYSVAETIVKNPDLQFIYSDSDKISPDGKLIEPYFTPDFNYDLLLAQNYVTHLSALRLPAVKEIGGYREGLQGAQDWDLVLRYLVHTCGFPFTRDKIHHISHVLYHWRQSEQSASRSIESKPYALQAGRRAVLDHLKATNQQCVLQPNMLAPVFNTVRYLQSDPVPMASIIIQTRDNPEQLGKCVNSILENTAYPNYEIIIMDNGWRKTALKHIKKNDKVTLIANPGAFNYAAANNRGAAVAKGEFLCFLNDDTQIVEPSWLNDLCACAARPWIGAVGPRLIYPNGIVQQNGIIIDMQGAPGQKALHAFHGNNIQTPGTVGRGVVTSEWSAVTGACLVVRKSVYDDLGGMDAENFPRDYNDVDFCLRALAKGYFNIVVSHIIVLHHEGQTKRKYAKDHTSEALLADEAKLLEKHGGFVDPYRNRNLAHTPNLDQLVPNPPELPWRREALQEPVLVINGGHSEAQIYYKEGLLAFCATLAGHYMELSYPRMDRVAALDTRDAPADLLYICQFLGINRIILNGIGEGTYGILGYLQDAEKYGIEVEYVPIKGDKEENLPETVRAYLWAVAKKINLETTGA